MVLSFAGFLFRGACSPSRNHFVFRACFDFWCSVKSWNCDLSDSILTPQTKFSYFIRDRNYGRDTECYLRLLGFPCAWSVFTELLRTINGKIPLFSFFKGPVYSYGFLASGMVLAIMIVPIITSISRDALMQTPQELKDAGRAMGLTSWEIVRKIMFPFAKSSIIGAVILGLGRALGETMAVAMVSGTATSLPVSIYSPINSMAAFMALSLDGAQVDPTKMFIYALVEMAALLLIITMIVNVVARILVRHGFITSESFVQV